MAQEKPQSYANHARIVPAYHIGAFGILMINLVWSVYGAFTATSGGTIVSALLSVALLLMLFYPRVFTLTVQDRVIRLEMRLRLAHVLPDDLQSRINDLSVPQLVALRFASDAELPGLVRKVLSDNIQDRKVIKRMVTNWQADYLRA